MSEKEGKKKSKKDEWKSDQKISMTIKKGDLWKPDKELNMIIEETLKKKKEDRK